jgi:hypothetical protein
MVLGMTWHKKPAKLIVCSDDVLPTMPARLLDWVGRMFRARYGIILMFQNTEVLVISQGETDCGGTLSSVWAVVLLNKDSNAHYSLSCQALLVVEVVAEQ